MKGIKLEYHTVAQLVKRKTAMMQQKHHQDKLHPHVKVIRQGVKLFIEENSAKYKRGFFTSASTNVCCCIMQILIVGISTTHCCMFSEIYVV